MNSPVSESADKSSILVVDDTSANLAVAVGYLEDHGFQVLIAQDGEEGLMRAQFVQPDLILLDAMMPGIDGFETCRRLKLIESTREIPVIFMTALTDIVSRVAAFEAGGIDYITKPFQAEELLARIRAQLQLRSAQRRILDQHRQLQASETRYRRLFETAGDGILLIEFETGRILDANAAVERLLGYPREHFTNGQFSEVQPFREVAACRHLLAALHKDRSSHLDHVRLATRADAFVDAEIVGNVYQTDSATIIHCSIRDITDRKQAEARIRYMALHDALTGLPNRTMVVDRLAQAISLASRHQKRVAALILGLDRFREVNDALGHYVGDCLLEAISARLRSCLGDYGVLGRLEGDEFVLALPAVDNNAEVSRQAERLLGALAEPFRIEGHEIYAKASIGIGQYPSDGENPEALLRAAESAMHDAKQCGRGTHRYFSPKLSEATQRRLRLSRDLRHAHSRSEFVLYYQPLISSCSEEIAGFEALLRWNHPELGLISPAEFIPLLEELGIMPEVGLWVLRTACIQNAAWQRIGLPPVRIAVNLSASQLYRGDVVGAVKEALRCSGLDACWLELELTESTMLDQSDTTISIMNELRDMGVSLSLDDFGTGWSSLSYLTRFPLNRIKIDRSFVRHLSEPASASLINSIISMAGSLHLSCIAEGVETREQLGYLRAQKCPELQGYLFSPPVSAEKCTELFSQTAHGLCPPEIACS